MLPIWLFQIRYHLELVDECNSFSNSRRLFSPKITILGLFQIQNVACLTQFLIVFLQIEDTARPHDGGPRHGLLHDPHRQDYQPPHSDKPNHEPCYVSFHYFNIMFLTFCTLVRLYSCALDHLDHLDNLGHLEYLDHHVFL